MKKHLLTALLAMLAGVLNTFAMNEDGHVLTDLWRKYEQARKADRPQKEAEILSQIKSEALTRHLPADFYDAATQYVGTVRRRDWKQSDKLREQLAEEVKRFDEPLVTFLWMDSWNNAGTAERWAYVKEHPKGFEGCQRSLHRGLRVLGGSLNSFLRSDYEYVLWRLLQDSGPDNKEVYEALKARLDGSYPGDGALAYYMLSRKSYTQAELPRKKAELQALQNQYAGKALALFPEADLLEMQFAQLVEDKADDKQFGSLYKLCQGFESRRKAFRGDEAKLADAITDVAHLKGVLEGKDLDLYVETGKASVVFQNLSHATLTLRRGKTTIQTWKVQDPVQRFYLKDTVSVELPTLPDGDYSLEAVNGKYTAYGDYSQYTLSIATRTDAEGHKVYVTDYETGEPLPSVTLRLMKSNQEIVATTTLKLDGFTPFPEAFEKAIKDGGDRVYYRLEAVIGDRRSETVGLGSGYRKDYMFDGSRCNIYKDRGAYNPGDVVKFKAVVYKGDPRTGLEVEKGRALEVRLHDSEDKTLETRKLSTNEWGAVSGEFTIPEGLRGGRFRLEVVGLGSDYFRVDEFVLPTFDLSFDPLTELYLAGSEVPVSGKVVSYSGHNLSGARVALTVSRYGDVVFEKEESLGADNRFAFQYPTSGSGYYSVRVKVTDATGETQEFGTGNYVGRSLSIDSSFPDALDVNIALARDEEDRYYRPEPRVVGTRSLRMVLQARDGNGNKVPLPVSYSLYKAGGALVTEGSLPSGQEGTVELPASGLYTLKTRVSATAPDGDVVEESREESILCVLPADKSVAQGVARIFLPGATTVGESASIDARLGSASGKIWVVAALFGTQREVLATRRFTVEKGSLGQLCFPYLESYPDAVRLQLFYFQDGEAIRYEREFRRAKDKYVLPLSFTRFHDKAFPGTEYSFTLKTTPGVEALVAAWDKSLDAIQANSWPVVSLREVSAASVPLNSACGHVGGYGARNRMVAYGMAVAKSAAAGEVADYAAAVMDDAMVEEEAAPLRMEKANAQESYADEGVVARTDFSAALTFQPQLYPTADGTLTFSFKTSDKLSTYYVRVYAHDKTLHNAVCEQEMVVSLPVKVSLQEPRFLFVGDVYEAAVTVSSMAAETVSGTMVFRAGKSVQQVPVKVKAGETQTRKFLVEADAAGELVLKASFVAPDFTDAVQMTVPVYPAAQQLTEAHSAVLRDGMSREALLKELRARFVNVPASEATLKDISVLDMVKDAIPSHVHPKGKDVLSLSEAWYVRLMASRLGVATPEEDPSSGDEYTTEALFAKVMACRNPDGGFAWFESMNSNAIITAVLLERFALLRDRGFEIPDMTATVKFLDNKQFGTSFPYWCGWVSDAQYMRVRALYPEVPFQVKPATKTDKERLKEFKKYAKSYLTPSAKEGRGLEGQILAKARRLLTLRSLNASAEGKALAKAWGIKMSSKLEKSVQADVTSLVEYAVEHRDGGWYYPNAVMPWRGLLESEAYAHALLCQLLQGDSPVIADGIRLWLMLQKETQQWESEPAFIDAITAILDGSEAVLNTRVLALSASFEAPFQAIQASGNGFTVARKFFRGEEEILPGAQVKLGEKIRVEYQIWNAENRSFVRLTAGREASLRPVQQLSGYLGHGFVRPLRGVPGWSFTPSGYRHVKASATEFYFDSYPEEKTTLTEEFFVTQTGRFQAPVVVIESLYAPHYRANSAYRPVLVSE